MIRSANGAEKKLFYSTQATLPTGIKGVADMELPEEQQKYIKGDYAWVAPGHYSVNVECIFSTYPLLMANFYQVDIDVQQKSVYAVQCLGYLRGVDVRRYPIGQAAQVQAALSAAAFAKLSISEGFYKTGHWAASNFEAGFSNPTDSPAQINVGPEGMITIAFGVPTPSITLTPSDAGKGEVNWSCKATGFAADALPAECR